MTTQESRSAGDRQFWSKAFQAIYLVAGLVATIGWLWTLGYFALALLGY